MAEANYDSGDDFVALHGGTHGSPVGSLLFNG